jgi:hypothetical protein
MQHVVSVRLFANTSRSLFFEINKYNGFELAVIGPLEIVTKVATQVGPQLKGVLNCTISNAPSREHGLWLCEGGADKTWWIRPLIVDYILSQGFRFVSGEGFPGASDALYYVFIGE